jgi:hypothetical protein
MADVPAANVLAMVDEAAAYNPAALRGAAASA